MNIPRQDSSRRRWMTAAVAALAMGIGGGAVAQEAAFPTRPVTIFAPYAAGSGPDAIVRKIADVLSRKWKQSVIIDNRPGGAGFVAIEQAQRVPADGHSLLLLDSEHVSALPFLYKKRGFNTLDVFDPVAATYRTSFLVAVSSTSKFQTMKDLVAAASSAQGQATYGSWAVGSAGHLGGVRLEQLTAAKMEHVAFREVSQLYIAVANGDVTWALGTLPSSRAAYDAGKLRYIAVAAANRLPQLPNVPTVAEAGGPADFLINSIGVIVARKGTPEAVQARIRADINEAVQDASVQASLNLFGFETLHWDKAEIVRQLQQKAVTYKALTERNQISLD